MSASAVVIIATIGKETLRRSILSVLNQTHLDTTCVVVVDGDKFAAPANKVLNEFKDNARVLTYQLRQNTGANGYVCHRIYGAMPLLVNQDYVFYLDDDNWYDPEHVSNNVIACETQNLDWCFSLRKIFLEDGTFLCNDECESIGYWPVWYNGVTHHIDTNCYCLKRQTAINLAPMWHKSRLDGKKVLKSADTIICEYLIQHQTRSSLIPIPSVNYNLGSWELSPQKEFFTVGNVKLLERHNNQLPWQQK